MTAAEYLTARGWCLDTEGDWIDTAHPSGTLNEDVEEGDVQPTAWEERDALTIQRARDEEKCREAWVRFAAALFDGEDFSAAIEDIADHADRMLAAYRARFCPEVQS